MVCAQVIGNHQAITIAGQSSGFQLNVMLPLIAYDLLLNIELLGNACVMLADNAIDGFDVERERIARTLDQNPILVTALNAVVGYDTGAEIAKRAYAQRRAVIDVAREMTDLDEQTLSRLLEPHALTGSR